MFYCELEFCNVAKHSYSQKCWFLWNKYLKYNKYVVMFTTFVTVVYWIILITKLKPYFWRHEIWYCAYYHKEHLQSTSQYHYILMAILILKLEPDLAKHYSKLKQAISIIVNTSENSQWSKTLVFIQVCVLVILLI